MTVVTRERIEIGSSGLFGRLFDPGSGRSLDEIVSTAWHSAESGRRSSCLVCGEPVAWNSADDSADCAACGSRLE